MHPIEVVDQNTFKQIASEVVGLSFDIHNELGRLFEEENYRKDLLRRLGLRAHDEVEIELSFESFQTSRFIDLVVDRGGIFELKTVAQIADVHRAQLTNYLFLTGARHGKIINFRPESVEHEFVNATMSREQRTAFGVSNSRWRGPSGLREQFESVVRDWGTGLCTSLYVEVAQSFLGGADQTQTRIPVFSGGAEIGHRKVRLSGQDSLLKITTLEGDRSSFELHARRFLGHTSMARIDWINVSRDFVTFESLTR